MFCENCGNKLPDGAQYCSFCGANQKPTVTAAHINYTIPQPLPSQPRTKNMTDRPKSVLGIVAIITAAVVAVVCTASWFLFFAGQPEELTAAVTAPVENEDWVEPIQKPSAEVDFAGTRDVADLIGVWAGELEYTEISGDWTTFGYPVSEGDAQPFLLKITDGSPELNWRQAILRIEGGDAAVLKAGFEGRFLEIRGEWQSCDVSISVEYDEARGGFAGIGEYIHSEKHASFDFFISLADENAWDNGGDSTSEPSPVQTAMVSDKTITVSMDYDSGEGVYTGEVNGDGAPHGQGRFAMRASDNGKSWSYEGQWQNGEITGKGVMTQDDFIFTGSFKSGLMEGYCEITDDGILRYKGMCAGGKLHGAGTLYTSSGMLLFEGEFQNDMLVESAAARQARGTAFKPECADMDDMLYDGCMAEDNTFGYPVAVWGFPLAMGEQTSNGTIVIGHMGEDSYPVCLVYRYGLDEPKMTGDDWINAWGVVAGLYEYVDGSGLTVTCPMIEVVCWDNEQEGL